MSEISKDSQTLWIDLISNADVRFSLEDSCRFWRDDIEFNFKTEETKSFADEIDMISQCSRRKWMISVLNLKKWFEIWFLSVIDFITDVEESRLIC